MLKEERFHLILSDLALTGRVLSSKLSETLNVSEDTIRRDLYELAHMGKLRRVHGGALPALTQTDIYTNRIETSTAAKIKLAQRAAALLTPGQVVFVDGGTTNNLAAQALPKDLALTVITNAPTVAAALIGHDYIEVIMLGGTLSKQSATVVGADTVEQAKRVHADICLLGLCAIHADAGITADNASHVEVKRIFVSQSARVIAIATADKLNTIMPFHIANLDAVDVLITDAHDDAHLNAYAAAGIQLL